MTERRAKSKARLESRPSGARRPTLKVKKNASAGTARTPKKAGAKATLAASQAKPGASHATPVQTRKGKKLAGGNSGGQRRTVEADGDAPLQALAGVSGREQATGEPASRLIDQRIRDLGGWRGETLARMRALILEADPEMTEQCKWRGIPVWSHHGIVCTGESYTKVVKLTFARGASIRDPSGLFNSSLEGNTRRAIDIREGEKVDAGAFQALIKAAVAQNGLAAKKL